MGPLVEAKITIIGSQADATAFISLILPILFLNVLWTGSIGSRASLYLIDCPQLLIQRIRRRVRLTHTYLLFMSFALACSCESVFFIKIWDASAQAMPQISAQYCFVPCLFLQIAITVLLQATVVHRIFYLGGGQLRPVTVVQATLHQVPLLACGVVFALSILTSDSRKDALLCMSIGVWLVHIVGACVSLVISLKDIRGSSALSEEERLVNWLNTGIAALNTVGYSLMILNVCWYIYSPSLIRLVLHIVLSKIHISFMTMLLHMSEGPDDGEPHESAAEWVLSKQEEKRLAGLSAGASLV